MLTVMCGRSGEGRAEESGANLYENFAEATLGKGRVDMKHVIPTGTFDMQDPAQQHEDEEKAKDAHKLERRSEIPFVLTCHF